MSANVGYATLQIIPSAKGFAGALAKETDPHFVTAGKSGGSKMGGAVAGGFLPKLAPLAGAMAGVFAVDKVKDFFSDAIAQASDLNEAGTKLQVVFGSATGDVLKFAGGGAKALGQSALDVQNAAATFGVYGKAAGLAGKANADFSTGLVSLSTDMASFYNADPSEVMQAIASGLRGEAEPLRQYGVLLDDATLRQEALKQGLIKTTKDALTPQQKVLAAHAVIMRQTSLAQGDFQRTSGGLANQQRILSAQITDLKGRIGAALLPTMVSLATFATGTLLPGLSSLGGVFDKVKTAVVGVYDVVVKGDITGEFLRLLHVEEDSTLILTIFQIRDAVVGLVGPLRDALMPVFQAVWSFVQANLHPVLIGFGVALAALGLPLLFSAIGAAVGLLTGALALLFSPVIVTTVAIAALVAGVIIAWNHFETFRNVVTTVAGAIASAVTTGFEVVRSVIGSVVDWVSGKLQGFMAWARPTWTLFLDFLGSYLTLAWGVWKGIFEVGFAVVSAIFTVALAAIKSAWSIAWTVIGTVLKVAWDLISSTISGALQIIGGIIQVALALLTGHWSAAWDGVKRILSGAWTMIQGAVRAGIDLVLGLFVALPGKILSALGDMGSALYSAGKDLLLGMAKGIGDSVGAVVSAAKDAAGAVVDGVKGALGIHSPSRVMAELGAYTSEGFALGITKNADLAADAMTRLVAPPPVSPMDAALGGSAGSTSVVGGSSDVVAAVAALAGQIDGLRAEVRRQTDRGVLLTRNGVTR